MSLLRKRPSRSSHLSISSTPPPEPRKRWVVKVASGREMRDLKSDLVFPYDTLQARAVVKDFAEMIAGRSPQAAAAGARESPHASTPMADDFVSLFLHLHCKLYQNQYVHIF
jgi:hypothetical protein